MKPSAKITVPEVAQRFGAYLAKHPAWGSLHIVLDDMNVTDQHVHYCIDYATQHGDTEGAALGNILLQMSITQRKKIGNIASNIHN